MKAKICKKGQNYKKQNKIQSDKNWILQQQVFSLKVYALKIQFFTLVGQEMRSSLQNKPSWVGNCKISLTDDGLV